MPGSIGKGAQAMPETSSALGTWIKRFLLEYLPTERNLAINTLRSYRDGLTLLLPFVAERCRKPVERLAVEDLSADRVTAFLGHLEQERGCSVQTRNLRLTAIRSFARYVAVRDAALVEWAGSIRAIPLKKTVRPRIVWLSAENMDAMIAGPDRRAVAGRVEHALLLFLYNTGARASEAAGLRVEDLHLPERTGENARATIHGKGGKVRVTPIWTSTAKALAALSRDRPPGCGSVFWSRHRKPTPGMASSNSWSAPRPACRNWQGKRSRLMYCGTAAPVTSFAPASTSTPFAPGSATCRSRPPTSTPKSISRPRKRR